MTTLRTRLFLTTTYAALGCFAAMSCAEAFADSKEEASSSSAKQHSVMKISSESFQPTIPRVWLSDGHSKQCKVGVGESFPVVKLPNLEGAVTDLASLRGKKATVVLFWHPDRWMARTALVDMQRDLVSKFDPEQLAVVGIAVHQQANTLPDFLREVHADFPQLVDTSGEALSKVGTFALPRLYVLDSEGTIVWFDIEYSEATRRELQQVLGVLLTDNE